MCWPLLNMYSDFLDLGQEVSVIMGTFVNRKKGLSSLLSVSFLLDAETVVRGILLVAISIMIILHLHSACACINMYVYMHACIHICICIYTCIHVCVDA